MDDGGGRLEKVILITYLQRRSTHTHTNGGGEEAHADFLMRQIPSSLESSSLYDSTACTRALSDKKAKFSLSSDSAWAEKVTQALPSTLLRSKCSRRTIQNAICTRLHEIGHSDMIMRSSLCSECC